MFRVESSPYSAHFVNALSLWRPFQTGLVFVAVGCALAAGVGTGDPITGLLLAGLLLGLVTLPAISIRPITLLCLLVGFTVTNLTDVLIVRFGIPSISKTLIALIFLWVAFEAFRDRRWPQIDLAAIVLLIVVLVSSGLTIFWAYDEEVAADAFFSLMREVMVVLLMLAVLQSMDDLRAVSRAILGGLTVISILGAISAFLGDYDLRFWGLTNFAVAHIAGLVDSYRFIGPLTDPNAMGRILLLGIPFGIYELLGARTIIGRLTALACLVSLLTGVVLTYSRGAMLALAVTMIFIIWKHKHQLGRLALILVPSAVILLGSLPASYWDRAQVLLGLTAEKTIGAVETDESVDNRLEEMLAAVEVFKDHPVLGAGIENYPTLFERYTLEHHFRQRFEPRQAHSEILRVAADMGLMGLVVYLTMWGICTLNAARVHALLAAIDPRNANLAFAIMLALIGYFCASLVLHESYARNPWLILGMALALPQCVRNLTRETDNRATDGHYGA